MLKQGRFEIISGATPDSSMSEYKKFWNVATISGDSAEITLYGEVRSRRPVDWWTGEPLPGLFITPEGFLEDLEAVKDKQNITVRINSVGGDTYTALAIYTRLKELKGNTVVVVDGIAASAGSLIAMAGDTIKMPAGSLMMIHDPAFLLWDLYKAADLNEILHALDTVAQAGAEIYSAKSGIKIEDVREMMTKETWMTGREAVEKGFANEIMFDNEPQMSVSEDRSMLFVNGMTLNIGGLKNIPDNIPVKNMPVEAVATANENKLKGGKRKLNTIEELRNAYPELTAQLESTAKENGRLEGVKEERTRLKSIEDIQAAVGDAKLLEEAKYGDNPCTAEQLAFKAMKQQSGLGTQHLNDMMNDNKSSGVTHISAAPNGGNDNDNKDEATEIKEMVNIYNEMQNGGARR